MLLVFTYDMKASFDSTPHTRDGGVGGCHSHDGGGGHINEEASMITA